jgi:drug/metabolite transporter (DMT)-like permease
LAKASPDLRANTSSATSGARSGFLQIHLAVFLFGFSGLLGRVIRADPPFITFWRTLTAGIALLVFLIIARGNLAIRSRRDGLTLLLSGIVLGGHWCAFFESIRVSSVSIALVSFATFPVWIAFLEPLFFHERLSGFDIGTALLAATGIVVATPAWNPADPTAQGIFWGMCASVSFAVLALFNRGFVRTYPPLTVAFYQLAFAAAASLPLALPAAAPSAGRDWILLLILGVLCTAAAQALYIGSLRYIQARTAGIVIGLEPVYGILFAWILLGEAPAARTAAGGLIVLAAVYAAMIRKSLSVPAEIESPSSTNP